MEEKKLKILTVGDNPLISTGYGTVWMNLLDRWCKLKPEWEFYHIGWQNQDRKHKRAEGYWMLPMGKIEYGYDAVAENLMRIQPDFLVTLCDVGWQAGYQNVVYEAKKNGWKGKWIMYTPVDTESWTFTWDEIFAAPDINVAMSKFGEQQLNAHKAPNVLCIPHGVDIKAFNPLENKHLIREKYGIGSKFVVGFVGRNQRRKMIDRLLQSFANFAEGKDDVVLLAHTDEEPPKDGWSIPYNLWIFNIANKVKLTKSKMDIAARQKIDADNMNEIYNMMDVFLYTTGGEGFGLPGLECQASGVPLIMNNTTTALDLCKEDNKIDVLLDKYGRKMIDRGTNGVYFVYPDDKSAAQILERHYKEWKENKQEAEQQWARQNAEKYNWDQIAPMWLFLFQHEHE
jgi:glycosyltransferase involved in cell wall biosynthesis